MAEISAHPLLDGLHPLEVRALRCFEGDAELSPAAICSAAGIGEAQCRSAVEWLRMKGALEVAAEESVRWFRANAEAIPESRLLGRLRGGVELAMADLDEDQRQAAGNLRKAGALRIAPGGALQVADLDRAADYVEQQALLEELARRGRVAEGELNERQRGLAQAASRKRGRGKGSFIIEQEQRRSLRLTAAGQALAAAVREAGLTGDELSVLTPEMIREGTWRKASFRRYHLGLKPAPVVVGRRHPYREFLDGVKRQLTAMGFEEMTGPLVESEFWNMDALFMPQFHSARDIHDAYFIKQPTHARAIEEPYYSEVARAHQEGGSSGSRGWRYRFDGQRTRRLVLRTQGTALSARWLRKARVPGKYYAMARCFRHDQVDATHGSEFIQVEGIVLGTAIHFGHLLGLLRLFAMEVARAEELKFLPAYFPFTEPSVEVHIRHPQIGWMEMGGAGIFRPEVTHPQGVEVPVIAWGLGLDRMAMVALGIQDIRELFSPDLESVRARRVNLS